MHHMTKKSAVAKYAPMLAEGKGEDEIKSLLYEENYSVDDVDEIWAALQEPGSPAPVQNQNAPAIPVKKTVNKTFEEWKSSPVYETIYDGLGKKMGRKLTGFNKDGSKPLRKTSIAQEKADLLNAQSENTGVRLFPVGE